METLPMPLDSLASTPGGLDDFRITAPREIAAVLKQLCDGNVLLNMISSDGAVFGTTLWTIDAARDKISFSAHENDPKLSPLLECDEAVVVGYLDSVKVQFDVSQLVLVRGGRDSVLSGAFPRQMFRIQRRNGYRVRPLVNSAPVARLRHSAIAEMQLALRVLDLSIGGCALFLPDDVPPMQPGVVINRVQLDLDADTRLELDLRLQHVTSLNSNSRGVRLGCEFVKPGGDALRQLQRFIDQTQKRRRLMALD
jgi:c-di-GMP-binding flagellar brake protein YcgR